MFNWFISIVAIAALVIGLTSVATNERRVEAEREYVSPTVYVASDDTVRKIVCYATTARAPVDEEKLTCVKY